MFRSVRSEKLFKAVNKLLRIQIPSMIDDLQVFFSWVTSAQVPLNSSGDVKEALVPRAKPVSPISFTIGEVLFRIDAQ